MLERTRQPRSNLRPIPACPRTAIHRKGPIRLVAHGSVHASIARLTSLLSEAELAGPSGWLRRLPKELRQLRTPPQTLLLRKSYRFDLHEGKTRHSRMLWHGASRYCGPSRFFRPWASASGAGSAESSRRKGGVSQPAPSVRASAARAEPVLLVQRIGSTSKFSSLPLSGGWSCW